MCAGRQFLELGALDVDALGIAGVHAADDLVDEAAVAGQIAEIARSSHQSRVVDRPLEMAVRAFDGAVLMRDAAIVAGRGHAVVAAQFVVAARQVLPGVLVKARYSTHYVISEEALIWLGERTAELHKCVEQISHEHLARMRKAAGLA